MTDTTEKSKRKAGIRRDILEEEMYIFSEDQNHKYRIQYPLAENEQGVIYVGMDAGANHQVLIGEKGPISKNERKNAEKAVQLEIEKNNILIDRWFWYDGFLYVIGEYREGFIYGSPLEYDKHVWCFLGENYTEGIYEWGKKYQGADYGRLLYLLTQKEAEFVYPMAKWEYERTRSGKKTFYEKSKETKREKEGVRQEKPREKEKKTVEQKSEKDMPICLFYSFSKMQSYVAKIFLACSGICLLYVLIKYGSDITMPILGVKSELLIDNLQRAGNRAEILFENLGKGWLLITETNGPQLSQMFANGVGEIINVFEEESRIRIFWGALSEAFIYLFEHVASNIVGWMK